MALKRLLTRIFNKSKKPRSHIAQDIVTAESFSPASEVLSPSDKLPSLSAITQSTAAVTEATLPLNVTLRLSVVLSPTGDGWLPHVSLRQGQAFAALGTICEEPAAEGLAPLLVTPLPIPPVEFKINATAVQPAKPVNAIPNSLPSSIQGLGLFRLGTAGSQDEQLPNRASTTRPTSQCMAPIVEVQPCTAPVTPARHPLSRSIVATPDLARTPQTIESNSIETPEQHPGARPLIQIGSSVNLPIGVPSVVPTIPDESPPQKVNLDLQQSQLYEFPRLESQLDEQPLPALRVDDEPPRCSSGSADGGLHPGYPTRQDLQDLQHPPGLGSPFKAQQQIPLDNGPPPRPPRGETLAFLANMSPTFEPAPFYLQLHNSPWRPDVAWAGDVEIDSGAVTVQRVSNKGNITYTIEADGHKYLATAQVGSGGFGYVWYAIKDGKEEVAIKVVDKGALLARCVQCAKDGRPTTQQLFEGSQAAATAISAECDAFKRVTEERSPFLTPLLHAFEDKDNFYFVMRFYPQTLRTRARFGFMHWQLRLVAAELLVAMQHLHKLRIVHMDLKMENVLITPSGHVCLADFGNAQVMDRKLSLQQFHNERMYGTSGTEGYLPPERVGANGYNFKTDTWTYAVILLELFLINGGHWYSIYHNNDGAHKFGDDTKLPANVNEDRRLAFITPREEINLVPDADAKDLLLSILAPQHHTMRPSWESIRGHPFFASINWKKLANRGYDPMFKACFGNAPLRSVDSGKLAIKHSHPQLPAFKKAVHQQEKFHVALGRMHVNYKCPAKVARDPMHGETCKVPGTKFPGHACNCDLPADWHKM
ncbi:kinase-like protein [Rhizopogon vinicolor AM-OR11-026]|uniref:Kinase-like protein n=1 Tax=Rhizopogon vinicolor AM-OR11-026 TaxID=1314800 RepID=A0A1B7NEH2_9AGAM|nr:kinase-like protein [Rhizopogon vinicolor AM-OR11-026]